MRQRLRAFAFCNMFAFCDFAKCEEFFQKSSKYLKINE